jgi:DNA (cytosine-5)-methyltransferase 1
MGYHRAGFTRIVGVDHEPQPRYPFEFVQADALDYLATHGQDFDLIHASPPCQRWVPRAVGHFPDLITPTRSILQRRGLPYVIENVPTAPLENPVTLCGTAFGLQVVRHRNFETDPPITLKPAPCQHDKPVVKHGRPPDRGNQYHGITGHFSDVAFAHKAMGIDWKMTQAELAQAIPPAYTEWIGRQMLIAIRQSCPSAVLRSEPCEPS